jgi:RecA-family ATPase
MVEDSWQAGLDHTPKRRLAQTAEIEHMTIYNPKSAPEIAAQLIENGYQPIPIPHGQKGPNTPSWQNRSFSPTDFDADANIGIRCGDDRVAALDVDVTDAAKVEAILTEWKRRHPGVWMWRTGRAPKTLAPFRFTSEGERKRDIKLGDAGKVEILATGQQFVAFGIHPDTAKPYTWTDLDPTDAFRGVASALPEIAPDAVDDFLQWAADTYGPKQPTQLLPQQAAAAIQPPTGHKGPIIDTGRETSGFWRAVNNVAMADLDRWAPALFPKARKHATGAWRISSADLGRDLEEDLSIHPDGITDHGEERSLTPINVVQEHGGMNPTDAAHWLCDRLGIDPTTLGWQQPSVAVREIAGSYEIAEEINRFQSGIFRACDLHGKPVPERVWHVHDLIPANTVTLLSGDGGTGKSLCALQLAVSTALQRPWLGLAVRHGKAVYLSAEDDKAELHRRLADITRAENATLADLGDLTLRSLAGEDALLATVAKGGTLQATPLLEAIKQLLQHDCPDLLVLDTLADYFPGNENDRAQARQFIGMLRGLAINHRCAVVMLAHPSVAGMASGTGTSGSTGWNNSVRSRLYLSRVVHDGYEQNPDARVLRKMKSNYSGIGGEIALTWQNGVFVAEAPVTGLDRMAANAKAERVFLTLLQMFAEQGRTVNHAGGPTYAPKVFAEHPKFEGMTKRALKTAMDSLLHAGKIRIVKEGPPSKIRSHLALAE